jgi:hypothetical protein
VAAMIFGKECDKMDLNPPNFIHGANPYEWLNVSAPQ